MAPLAHVQPGDLITSQFINDFIDQLASFNSTLTSFNTTLASLSAAMSSLEERVAQLEDQVSQQPGERLLIERIEPPDAVYGQSINIIGGGFIVNDPNMSILIDGTQVPRYTVLATALVQAVVPALQYTQSTPVDITVENQRGVVSSKVIVGPKPILVPWVPTPPEVAEAMFKLSNLVKGEVVYDLGSGDGSLVIAAVQRGAIGVGIENDTALVQQAVANARKAKVRANFIEGDFFVEDFSKAQVVLLHLTDEANLRLRPKLEKLAPGTRIVSHDFDMGTWRPTKTTKVQIPGERDHIVYLWIV
jgi:hypothetical protein